MEEKNSIMVAQWSSHLLPPRAAKFKRFIKQRAEKEPNEQPSHEKMPANGKS